MPLCKHKNAGAYNVWFLVNEVVITEGFFPTNVLPTENGFYVLRRGKPYDLEFANEKNSKDRKFNAVVQVCKK